MKNIHIGSIIKQKVIENSMSVKEFADKINCDRTTVYDIFKRKSIDVDRLMKISEVLKYDFLSEIYLKRDTILFSSQTVYIAIEVDKSSLQKLDLPNGFTLLLKDSK